MGNSASKSSRTLKKSAEAVNSTLKQQHSKPNASHLNQQQVFTQRPPENLENVPHGLQKEDLDKPLLSKALEMGYVHVEDNVNFIPMDPNHESLKVLNNRKVIESQYDGLFKPRNYDEPDTPERFMTEAQKRETMQRMEQKKKKQLGNVHGLIDSSRLSDLIIEYKLEGDAGLKEMADELKLKNENVQTFRSLIDNGLISLPSHKVILEEIKDPKTKKKKQQLKIVKDDWVKKFREEAEAQKLTEGDKKVHDSKNDEDVVNQIEILEGLVSKSQITTEKVPGPTGLEEEQEEKVMHRPKKVMKGVIREL